MNDKSVPRRIHADRHIVNQTAHEIESAPTRSGGRRQCVGDHRRCGYRSVIADGDDHSWALLIELDLHKSNGTVVRVSVDIGKRFAHRYLDLRGELQARSDTQDCLT